MDGNSPVTAAAVQAPGVSGLSSPGSQKRSPVVRYFPNIGANRAPNIVDPEFLNRIRRWVPSRPVPAASSQIAGVGYSLAPVPCLDEKNGTNPVNPKWPNRYLGDPLRVRWASPEAGACGRGSPEVDRW